MSETQAEIKGNPTSSSNTDPALKGWQIALLGLMLVLGFFARLVDLKDAPLDFHGTRQLRSAIIARSVYLRLSPDANPALRQEAMDLANLEIYEPPILEQIVGAIYALIGSEQVWIARIYNALFWMLGGLAVFLIGRRSAKFPVILAGLAFYCFLPFSIIASRSFQPDPWMVMWTLWTAYAALRWCESPTWKWAVIAGLLGGFTILVKAFAGFYVAGIMIAAVLMTWRLPGLLRNRQVWAMAVLTLAPTAVYYLLFNTQRSSDFLSFWMVSLSGLVLSTNFYADWLAMIKGLMGLPALLTAVLGLTIAERRTRGLLLGFWAGYAAFGLAMPYQYTTHEYYHLALIPLVTLSVIPLLQAGYELLQHQEIFWRAMAIGAVLFAAFYCFWVARSVLVVSDYSNEPASWRRVGEAIPQDSRFIALTADYGMRLRYYGWRNENASWPSQGDLRLFSLAGQGEVTDFEQYFKDMTAGNDYFLVTAFGELDAQPQLREILERYPVLVDGNGFKIYDLRKSTPS